MSQRKDDITLLLPARGRGEDGAFDRLMPMVYDDLHRIARRQLRRGRPGQTLNTAGLVHEVNQDGRPGEGVVAGPPVTLGEESAKMPVAVQPAPAWGSPAAGGS